MRYLKVTNKDLGKLANDRAEYIRPPEACATCGADLPFDVECLYEPVAGKRYCVGNGCFRSRRERANPHNDSTLSQAAKDAGVTEESESAQRVVDSMLRGSPNAVRNSLDDLRTGGLHPDGLLHDSVHEEMSGARPARAVRSTAELVEKYGFEPVPDHRKDPFVRPMRIMVDGFAPNGQEPNNHAIDIESPSVPATPAKGCTDPASPAIGALPRNEVTATAACKPGSRDGGERPALSTPAPRATRGPWLIRKQTDDKIGCHFLCAIGEDDYWSQEHKSLRFPEQSDALYTAGYLKEPVLVVEASPGPGPSSGLTREQAIRRAGRYLDEHFGPYAKQPAEDALAELLMRTAQKGSDPR